MLIPAFLPLFLSLLAWPMPMQEGYLSPQQQKTLMEYLGPQAKPLVPTAIKRTSEADAGYAANWIAGRRKQPLLTYSLNEKLAHYILKNDQTLDSVFAAAVQQGAVIYIEDADLLFGLKQPTAAQTQLAKQLLQLTKKNPVAVLFQCIGEDSWYELANAGFGIVDLKL
jgi:hypothetical protein